MRIIEPSFEIIQCPDGEECLAFLEKCARTCYKSEGKIDEGFGTCGDCDGSGWVEVDIHRNSRCPACQGTGKSDIRISEPSSHKLIRRIVKSGHESVIEHMVISVRFIFDRGVSHEMVRHRIASFSQESTRYCNYSDDRFGNELTFIRPCFWPVGSELYNEWVEDMEYAERRYLSKIEKGAKPEEARSILPNSLKTEIVVTANLREWRSVIFTQRSSNPKAHVQMRQVMQPLHGELCRRIPVIFDGAN